MTKEDIKPENIVKKANGHRKEFMDFLGSYNIIQLAVGMVVGNSVKDLVNSLVNNIVMPFINLITPAQSFAEMTVTINSSEFKVGMLISSLINFLVIAFVVYIVVIKILRIEIKK